MPLTIDEATALLPGVPLFESPFFDAGWREQIGERAFAVALALRRFGFATIELPRPDLPALAAEIREALAGHYDWEAWRATGAADMRIKDAWRLCEAVRRLADDDGLAALLSAVYGRAMFPFQTLTFACGSQQHVHADAVHFNTVPDGFMCGVWVALEDVGPDSGPLLYAPGSHRYRHALNLEVGRVAAEGTQDQRRFHPLWAALLEHGEVTVERFLPRRGQALIWSAHLLHGGDIHRALEHTRWSQVTHYFGADCLYLTPMASNTAVGPMALRQPVDVRSGAAVANRFVGAEVDEPALRTTSFLVPSRDRFDREAYLRLNPDVVAAKLDPYDHYLRHGRFENRRLS